MYTRNGVIYNLAKSKYRFTTENFEFYFSSLRHLQKFAEQLQQNRDIINYTLSRKFKIKLKLDDLADIVLYNKLETRGFYILKLDDHLKTLYEFKSLTEIFLYGFNRVKRITKEG